MTGNNGRGALEPRETIVEFLDDGDAQDWPLAFRAAGYRGPGWYYWNRDWSRCHGPFDDEARCEAAWKEYAATAERPACDMP